MISSASRTHVRDLSMPGIRLWEMIGVALVSAFMSISGWFWRGYANSEEQNKVFLKIKIEFYKWHVIVVSEFESSLKFSLIIERQSKVWQK